MDVHKVTTTFMDKLEVTWTIESTVMPGYTYILSTGAGLGA